jgi:hypothetical protein
VQISRVNLQRTGLRLLSSSKRKFSSVSAGDEARFDDVSHHENTNLHRGKIFEFSHSNS